MAVSSFKNAVAQVNVLHPGLDLSLTYPLYEVREGKIVKPRKSGADPGEPEIIYAPGL